MINNTIEMKWQATRSLLSRWLNKHSDEQDFIANRQRERLIKILQNRYGYSKEKAALELDTTYSKAGLA